MISHSLSHYKNQPSLVSHIACELKHDETSRDSNSLHRLINDLTLPDVLVLLRRLNAPTSNLLSQIGLSFKGLTQLDAYVTE